MVMLAAVATSQGVPDYCVYIDVYTDVPVRSNLVECTSGLTPHRVTTLFAACRAAVSGCFWVLMLPS